MTGPEHFREAERLLTPGEYDESEDQALVARDVALAQVHATLALTAAYAEVNPTSAWHDVAGTPAEATP
jgi:hypothetical protein